jgi:hypothetical protein
MKLIDKRPPKRCDMAQSEIRLKKTTAGKTAAIERLNDLLGGVLGEAPG